MEIQESQCNRTGCVKQQEEGGLTARGGEGPQDKEILCMVVKKNNMKETSALSDEVFSLKGKCSESSFGFTEIQIFVLNH